ncbi:hypothetical protein IH992_31995 [Candidatus Poribacteria bacterium]|nr:hypothetical protein [Candidatus Poribacteria bacterium]
MPISYHGTSRNHATHLAQGKISVSVGAGEFGRGFYAQSSIGNAMRWAAGRSPNPAVLVINIESTAAESLLNGSATTRTVI